MKRERKSFMYVCCCVDGFEKKTTQKRMKVEIDGIEISFRIFKAV